MTKVPMGEHAMRLDVRAPGWIGLDLQIDPKPQMRIVDRWIIRGVGCGFRTNPLLSQADRAEYA